ncbi:conjugal transfer protein [Streptomyces sp. NPDC014983]|uniref:conjugal transfer protein n=1 Tax=Streptomyces sp. NPDC014983 TaxID=3364933 RepID=UPI0036FA4EF8
MSEKKKLTGVQKAILGLALVPMVAVGIAGGIGTYSNISAAYGKGTAIGALAAGEGATAVLAFLFLGVTLLGQSVPRVVRYGLWLLPATAAVMGATAAREGLGQTIVYAATPMAITASAEGLAFLARRIVVHQDGQDVEAEARAAEVIRDLAYHQARAAAHPSDRVRKRSVRISWRLARKVGNGDTRLGTELLDVQLTRLTQGADTALAAMFTPGLSALPTASAHTAPALLSASANDATSPRTHESTIHADANGRPADHASDQHEDTKTVRPALALVHTPAKKAKSLAADVRDMVKGGVDDVRVITDALATRHGRQADDPKFKATVGRSFRAARAAFADDTADDQPTTGQYL